MKKYLMLAIALAPTAALAGVAADVFSAAPNESGDKEVFAWDTNSAAYQNVELSVSRELGGFEVTGSVTGTTIDKDYNKNADTAFVLSVKRSFDLYFPQRGA